MSPWSSRGAHCLGQLSWSEWEWSPEGHILNTLSSVDETVWKGLEGVAVLEMSLGVEEGGL